MGISLSYKTKLHCSLRAACEQLSFPKMGLLWSISSICQYHHHLDCSFLNWKTLFWIVESLNSFSLGIFPVFQFKNILHFQLQWLLIIQNQNVEHSKSKRNWGHSIHLTIAPTMSPLYGRFSDFLLQQPWCNSLYFTKWSLHIFIYK